MLSASQRDLYRYTGKERDEETGLGHHGARYYASWLGRWTAADPIGLGDGNPDPALGKSTTGRRYQVTVENFFGEIFDFSVNYDPVNQIFGTIKRASGKP